MPNTPAEISNQLLFAYLNSHEHHDHGILDYTVEDAAVALVRELADYIEDTDFGVLLHQTLVRHREGIEDVVLTRDELRPSTIEDIIENLEENDTAECLADERTTQDQRIARLKHWVIQDHGASEDTLRKWGSAQG